MWDGCFRVIWITMPNKVSDVPLWPYGNEAYIQENPGSVKVMCFLVGLTLLVFSILGVINPFAVFGTPKEYLANVYNIIFSAPWAAEHENHMQ
jgi:hypothetical protein